MWISSEPSFHSDRLSERASDRKKNTTRKERTKNSKEPETQTITELNRTERVLFRVHVVVHSSFIFYVREFTFVMPNREEETTKKQECCSFCVAEW